MPSSLKWTVHHSGSGEVIIAVRVPITMNAMSSDDMRCVVMRDTDRYTMYAVSPSVTVISTIAQNVMTGRPMKPSPSSRKPAYVARNASAVCTITTEIVLTVNFHDASDLRHSWPGWFRDRQ